MKQNDDILLHKNISKHTNKMIPYSSYVSYDKYPAQNSQLINTTVTLKYRDRSIADNDSIKIESSGRPLDDEPFVAPVDIEGDDNIVYSKDFKILRADKSEPNIFIAISVDYNNMIIGKTDEDGNIIENIYPVSTMEFTEYVGLYFSNMYFACLDTYDAVVLSINSGEPCYTILMEYTNPDKTKVRFVLGDECFSKLIGYIDKKFNIVKMDNIKEWRAYTMNRNIYEIADLRKKLLENITIDIKPEEDNEQV